MSRLRIALFAGCAGWLGLRAWAALRPTAFPYIGRPVLDIPRPLITRRGLLGILDPVAGERMLEVGPGTGYYTLPVAARLEPAGVLEVLDVRRSFLDHPVQRARGRGLTNVVPKLGDGRSLPTQIAVSTRPTRSPCSARYPTRRRRWASGAAF